MSISNVRRHFESESYFSQKWHDKGTPLLLSTRSMKEYGCGQIDIVCVMSEKICLIEAKNNGSMGRRQREVYLKAGTLLSHIFDKSCLIIIEKFSERFTCHA